MVHFDLNQTKRLSFCQLAGQNSKRGMLNDTFDTIDTLRKQRLSSRMAAVVFKAPAPRPQSGC